MSKYKNFLIPYIFVTTLGVLFHFTYEWSNENFIVGLFSATNESTWEHLKLAFFPLLILTIWQATYQHRNDDYFLPSRTIGILAAMAFIVVAFYTFTGVVGKNIDFVNIAIYFLGILFGFLVEKTVYGKTKLLTPNGALIVLFLFTFLFVIFTFSPPNLGIFKAP